MFDRVFAFEPWDKELVEQISLAIRKVVDGSAKSPRLLHDAGLFLQALSRLPLQTPGFFGSISAGADYGDGRVSRTISLDEDTFRLYTYEAYYDEGIGWDGCTNSTWEVTTESRSEPSDNLDEWLSCCAFRRNPATDSETIRPLIPI